MPSNTPKKLLESDQTLYELWLGQWSFACVIAADELGVFALLRKNAKSLEVAKALNLDPKGVEILCDLLVNLAYLEKNKTKKYSLSATAKTYLDPQSSFYWGPILLGLRENVTVKRLIEALRKGGFHLASNGKAFTEMWQAGEVTVEAARHFIPRMHILILPTLKALVAQGHLDKAKDILDVGGGSGALAVCLSERKLKAKYTLFDLPAVCTVAEEYIGKKTSLGIEYYPKSFFHHEWPSGKDVVFFSNIFHDWPPDICHQFAEKAYAALKPGGRIILNEMILDEAKTGPRFPLLFSLLMFINHTAQQFSEGEMFSLLKSKGFRKMKRKEVFGHYSVIIAEK